MPAYISFALGAENFALDVSQIKEVYHFIEMVRVPQAPSFIAGLVSLRGRVIPVMDLGLRLGLGQCRVESREIIVIEVQHADGPWLLGLLVETILGLEEVQAEDVLPPPQLPNGVGRFITGILKGSGYYVLETGWLMAEEA